MFLGIDIGTTKAAAVIADGSGALAAVASGDHHAGLSAPTGRAEQDPAVLLSAAWRAVCELPADLRRQVRAVGITGQMHGVLLLDSMGRPVSPMITWQDQRCLEDGFLSGLVGRTGRPLCTGFGCATLAWLAAHRSLPAGAARACTIHDYAVARLCGRARPLTDPTDAASWGLFGLRKLAWDQAAMKAAGIAPELLPGVRPSGSLAGAVSDRMAGELGLVPGIPVAVAIGDNQASLLATLRDPLREIAITIGTGAQLSAVLPPGEAAEESLPGRPYEYRPYPGGRYLVTAAALSGGSAWAWLTRTVASWLNDLGLPAMTEDALYARLNTLGLAAADGPLVFPHFLGERHAPGLRGSIAQLGPDSLPLGPLARGLARGIVTNLREMLCLHALENRTRVIGSGNALRRNPLLQRMVTEAFGLPLVMPDVREEAALGAAINAAQLKLG
jgi:sugar (pentulose or hexulose) kinase